MKKIKKYIKRKDYFALAIEEIEITARVFVKLLECLNIQNGIIMFDFYKMKNINELLNENNITYNVKFEDKYSYYRLKLDLNNIEGICDALSKTVEYNTGNIEVYSDLDINTLYIKDPFLELDTKCCILLIPDEYEIIIWCKTSDYNINEVIEKLYNNLKVLDEAN